MNSVLTEEMFKEYETAQIRQVINTAMVVNIYVQSEVRIENLFVELMYKKHMTKISSLAGVTFGRAL